MKAATLLLSVMLLSFAGQAQNAATTAIQWNVTDVFNMSANMYDGQGDKLILFPGDRIEWQDANGNLKFRFPIASVIGDWENINENGLIHFNFQFSGQPGELIVQRRAGTLSAEIHLYQVDAN